MQAAADAAESGMVSVVGPSPTCRVKGLGFKSLGFKGLRV